MPKRKGLSRDEKLRNLIVNQSLIFMGLLEEGFSDLAEKMTAALSEGTAAIADALGSKSTLPELSPALRAEIAGLVSEMRDEITSQWPKSAGLFSKYVSGKAFDRGIEIVDSYDFHRPRLTEELSDGVLASYVFLLKSGDEKLTRMFRELSEWQRGLPRPPWAS